VTTNRLDGKGQVSVAMLLENDLYPHDVRVRYEAESLVAAGYRVLVIAPHGRGQPMREAIDGVEVERFWLPMDHRGRVSDLLAEYVVAHAQLYTRGLRALLRGANVLHAHNPPDTLFVPALLRRRSGCKFVFDQHDLSPELFEQKFGRTPMLGAVRRAQLASLRLAQLVVVTNESQREAAIRGGAPAEEVIVVRNALRRADLGGIGAMRLGRLEDPNLLYVGTLESQDGVQHLPELLRVLIDVHRLQGLRLTVVGWGAERVPMERRLRELGLEGHVTFTGRTEHRRVLELIRAADICIDTAECNELNHRTTMVKVVEYLSLGRPTVAFALRETERTADGAAALAECGRWEQFAELIAELAGSEERRNQLCERASARAQALAWEHGEAALIAGYERMLESHG
jgi:glycosyltransferase involved in cell wall biosynthesis